MPERPWKSGEQSVSAQLSSLNFQLSLEVITVAHAPVHRVGSVTEELNRSWMGCEPSPITGTDGNHELLAWLK